MIKFDPALVGEEPIRLHMIITESWVRKVDEWRRKQPDLPNRSEAIRQLVLAGMTVKKGRRR